MKYKVQNLKQTYDTQTHAQKTDYYVRLGYQDERWLEPHSALLMLQVPPRTNSSIKGEKAHVEAEDDTHELQDET